MPRQSEKGQAIILVVVASSLFMLGALGLAVDGAQLYAHRQMAQNAADAAAQAGIMSIFSGTWASPAAHTCTTTDTLAPCVYARNDGFGALASDVVALDIPTDASVPGVNFASDTVHMLRVTITRPVTTGIMRLLGASSSTSIKAIGIAAIIDVVAPVPIIVTHPTNGGALNLGGTALIKICGGPARSIQVNSSDSGSITQGGTNTVDLSLAGPADSGTCTTGTGADFGDFGGPSSASTPSWLTPVGTTEHYIQPASPIRDPLASVPAPAKPAAAIAPVTLGAGVTTFGCPPSPVKPCQVYSPGTYASGINVQNNIAIFKPGLYYMDAGSGFQSGAHGYTQMCPVSDCPIDSTINSTQPGMVVFNKGGGTFNVGSNGDVNLVGSDSSSVYKGILFFEDRFAPANTGGGSHSLGGGGNLALTGTIYLTNCAPGDPNCTGSTMTSTLYQNLKIRGGGTSSTLLQGEIIVSALDIGGSGTIQMNLNAGLTLHVRQVALVH